MAKTKGKVKGARVKGPGGGEWVVAGEKKKKKEKVKEDVAEEVTKQRTELILKQAEWDVEIGKGVKFMPAKAYYVEVKAERKEAVHLLTLFPPKGDYQVTVLPAVTIVDGLHTSVRRAWVTTLTPPGSAPVPAPFKGLPTATDNAEHEFDTDSVCLKVWVTQGLHQKAWDAVSKHVNSAQEFFVDWAREASGSKVVKSAVFRLGMSLKTGVVYGTVRVPTRAVRKMLQASGKGGVFCAQYGVQMDVHWVKRGEPKGVDEWALVCEKLGLPGLTENGGRIGVRLDDNEQRKLVEAQYADSLAAVDSRPFFVARGIPPHASEESIVAVLEREGWADVAVVARFPGNWQTKFRSSAEGARVIRCKTTTVFIDDSVQVRRARGDDDARTWAKVVGKATKPKDKAGEPDKKKVSEPNKKAGDGASKKAEAKTPAAAKQPAGDKQQPAPDKAEEARRAENDLLREQNEFLKCQVLALTAEVAELKDLIKTLVAKTKAEEADEVMQEVNDKKRTREPSPPANAPSSENYSSRITKIVKRALSPLTHDHVYDEMVARDDWSCLRCNTTHGKGSAMYACECGEARCQECRT